MNLYELNQAGYNSLPELKDDKLEEAEKKLYDYLISHDANYYMMLNHDKRYFTIFTYGKDKHVPHWMAEGMIDIAQSLGTLKSIEIAPNMAEFWITDENNVCNMYAVFPYDRGVIEI